MGSEVSNEIKLKSISELLGMTFFIILSKMKKIVRSWRIGKRAEKAKSFIIYDYFKIYYEYKQAF
jgi:hypothetical protein